MKKYVLSPALTGLVSCVVTTMLFTEVALGHTNSVGYENAGPGSVNFWYGNWHSGTSFTEGSMQLIGPNGFNSTTAFTLLTTDKPEGLVDGVTNFYSDGSKLVGTNTGTRVYTWQGVNFENLAPGTYTFTYIPIASPTADWDPADNIIRSSSVTLTAEVLGARFIDNATFGSSPTAARLDSMNGTASGQMADVIALLQAMDDESQQRALQRVAPNTGSAMGAGSVQAVSGVLDTVAVRMDGIRSQNFQIAGSVTRSDDVLLASADSGGVPVISRSLDHSVWLKAFGSRADQDMDDGFAGYNATTGGLAFGMDTLVRSDTVIGVAVTYANTDVDMEDYRRGDGSTIDTYQLTGYATRDFGRFYAEAMLGYAYHEYGSRRDTTITGVAEGDYSGQQYAARVTAGLPIALGRKVVLTPTAGVEWNHLRQDSYTEKGAGALSMEVNSVSADRLQSLVGVKLATRYKVGEYSLQPQAQLGWRHQFDNDGIDTTATFTGGGAAFTTEGQKAEDDSFTAGIGLSMSKTDSALFSLQLDTEQASKYSAYAAQLVGQWMF